MEGGDGGRIILPFIHHSDLHFLLFDLQASLSAERVLGAFHHLLYCLF